MSQSASFYYRKDKNTNKIGQFEGDRGKKVDLVDVGDKDGYGLTGRTPASWSPVDVSQQAWNPWHRAWNQRTPTSAGSRQGHVTGGC